MPITMSNFRSSFEIEEKAFNRFSRKSGFQGEPIAGRNGQFTKLLGQQRLDTEVGHKQRSDDTVFFVKIQDSEDVV